MKLTRITLYTPAPVLPHVAAAYAAMLDTDPVTGYDERGELVEIAHRDGFSIELRPSSGVRLPRLEFRGPGAPAAAERLHDVTGGVQRHLYGGRWDSIAGVSVRLIGDGEDVPAEERERVSEAIGRGELEAELDRMRGAQ